MIARIRKSLENKEQGFTLIELLVVIIIIGILAAIAIPAFLNQREKAWVSQVESDLKNAAIAAESQAVDDNGDYSALNGVVVETNGVVTAAGPFDLNGFNGTVGVDMDVTAADATGFTLQATHANLNGGADVYTYDSDTGVIAGP
ncbi:prepilin-type N-terminal cleavage/methylation domain-containing protein [Actinotalea sp.]|uniref:prepilin-type N-terminal cleavage/methylation domain-containing protein n=1 Tax=Actinotalea sp. TaxID=1872145 RepID=UPI002B7F0A14|nr:prepilin-type N-terminal cleavage/methylation domain-containing protein [Actinotalea sp.]HQY33854.1 prepilin-type N-terminal cleavage/methylation domain-containing protein [Actinotalea sp.]HRA50021.1 prepilin-type N-terminal cleavage/methylation domain-containing protein [Actinotalea sp.]